MIGNLNHFSMYDLIVNGLVPFAENGNFHQADAKSYKKVQGVKMCCFGAETSSVGTDPVLDLYTTNEFSTAFYCRLTSETLSAFIASAPIWSSHFALWLVDYQTTLHTDNLTQVYMDIDHRQHYYFRMFSRHELSHSMEQVKTNCTQMYQEDEGKRFYKKMVHHAGNKARKFYSKANYLVMTCVGRKGESQSGPEVAGRDVGGIFIPSKKTYEEWLCENKEQSKFFFLS